MDKQSLISCIRRILEQDLNHPHMQAYSEDARLNEDLYLDSLIIMQLFVQLELQQGISVPEEAFNTADFHKVSELIDFIVRAEQPEVAPEAEIPSPSLDPDTSVHGNAYRDIKVHCFVSCVCDSLKRAKVDHLPFYFGVWDGEFELDQAFCLRYHSDTIKHDFYRDWFQKLFGANMRYWYQPHLSKADNIELLTELVEGGDCDQSVMVMLDMARLPERDRKFNVDPFPHYILLKASSNSNNWMMLDPDYRWEGELSKEVIIRAVDQPCVEGGWVFDNRELTPAQPQVIADYFTAGFFASANPLTDALQYIISKHGPQQELPYSHLKQAVEELPVMTVRKLAYKHGFAFFWRALQLPAEEFEFWRTEVEQLVKNFNNLHFQLLKLAETEDASVLQNIEPLLASLNAMEFTFKQKLQLLFDAWLAQQGLSSEKQVGKVA